MAGPDDKLADNAVASVGMLANWSAAPGGHPFFIGVGFHKPHIPWTIPTKWFARLPSIADTALPKHERPPIGMPPIAWNKGLGRHALDSYADANRYPAHAFSNGSWVSFPHNLTKAMRRGYYAAVSYTDHNIGRVLDALADSPAADNTVVAIMGDHGGLHPIDGTLPCCCAAAVVLAQQPRCSLAHSQLICCPFFCHTIVRLQSG